MAGGAQGVPLDLRGEGGHRSPAGSSLGGAVGELGERQVPLPVGVPHLRVVAEPPGLRWRGWRELRVVPIGVGVAERAQRLEAASGAGAQATGLAALLEPLLQPPGLRPVPDADQLDLAAGVQGGGQEPGTLATVAVGLGVVPAGQVVPPTRGEVDGEVLDLPRVR